MSCGDTNGDGIVTVDECTFTDEELQLILDTMGAHHFNFALTDVGAATHIVKVQARVTTAASSLLQAGATGSVGKGAVTVEEVRLVKDAVIIQSHGPQRDRRAHGARPASDRAPPRFG